MKETYTTYYTMAQSHVLYSDTVPFMLRSDPRPSTLAQHTKENPSQGLEMVLCSVLRGHERVYIESIVIVIV